MTRILRAAAAIGAAVLIFSLLKNKGTERSSDDKSLRDKAEEAVEETASDISEQLTKSGIAGLFYVKNTPEYSRDVRLGKMLSALIH